MNTTLVIYSFLKNASSVFPPKEESGMKMPRGICSVNAAVNLQQRTAAVNSRPYKNVAGEFA